MTTLPKIVVEARFAVAEVECSLTRPKDDGCMECRGAPGAHDHDCPFAILRRLLDMLERGGEAFVSFDGLGQPYKISQHPEHRTIGAIVPSFERVCILLHLPDDGDETDDAPADA